jgi:hypothetical protein
MPEEPLKIQANHSIRHIPLEGIIALFGGLLATGLAAAAAGKTLGEVLGGLVAATLLVPPLAAFQFTWRARGVIMVSAVAGISTVWLSLIGPNGATIGQWIELTGILAGMVFVLVGIASLLTAIRLSPVLAAAAAVLIGLAWLTWPIWLSGAMTNPFVQSFISKLVPINPPLVANGILTFTPPWTEQSIAYTLTLLDQDVPLRLPASALPCICVELVAALVLSIGAKMSYRTSA